MIVRYATKSEGIEETLCNPCCAPLSILNKMKEEHLKKNDRWLIEQQIIDDKGKIIFKKYLQEDEFTFEKKKIGCLEFKTEKDAQDFIVKSMERGSLCQMKHILDKEENKNKGWDNYDIQYKVVPFMGYTLPFIGSHACEHCPYCFGRSKMHPKWEMVGWNPVEGPYDEYEEVRNWSEEKEEARKMCIRDKYMKMRPNNYILCSAVYKQDKLSWKIKIKRYFYQLWVNKLEQPLINFSKKYHINPLYNKLNYGWWRF